VRVQSPIDEVRPTRYLAIFVLAWLPNAAAYPLSPEDGKLDFKPLAAETDHPKRYRLENFGFVWKLEPRHTAKGHPG